MRSRIVCATLIAGGVAAAGVLGTTLSARAQNFQKGAWDYKAIGPLAFSPSGVLFFADDQAGAVYGVELGEKPSSAAAYANVPGLGATIAQRLGTTAAGIEIKDMAVNPVSRKVYLSVRKTDGGNQSATDPANYALFAVDPSGQVMPVDLKDKPFAKVALTSPAPYRARQGQLTKLVGDIAYAKGRLLVAALSTEQFNSNLISVPVPFRADGVERYATSIYHVSHKKQETASPIMTLTTYRDGDKEYLMAAYVCTPVVRFNLEDLKAGQEAKGITVAELGSGNQPMAMIAYGKAGSQSLLLNNSAFGILKVDAKIAKETAAVNEKTTADRGNGGATAYPGIEVVSSLKGAKAYASGGDSLVVVKATDGGMALESMPLP